MGLGISYRALVAELAGVELDKGETRSDWMQRPLTASQCSYAALDVVYLKTIHEQLGERLQQRDRSAWHAEDCERLKRRASHRDGDPQPQRAMRGAAEWTPRTAGPCCAACCCGATAAHAARRTAPVAAGRHAGTEPWRSNHPPASANSNSAAAASVRCVRRSAANCSNCWCRRSATDEIAATASIPGHPQGEAKKRSAP
jgi:ribonuclease D